jgi:hypothetical protein
VARLQWELPQFLRCLDAAQRGFVNKMFNALWSKLALAERHKDKH